MMLYLTGCKNPVITQDLTRGTMGLLQTPATRYNLQGVHHWALDNGAFTNKYPGDTAYLALLRTLKPHQSRCLFVAAPDVVGDPTATLHAFQRMAPQIKAAGWPVALVAQDGLTPDQVPWDETDWLFIGGNTEWKLSAEAAALIRAAQTHGKHVHVGRVNSARRYRWFAGLGCDTADGTYIGYGPNRNAPHVREWMRQPVQLHL